MPGLLAGETACGSADPRVLARGPPFGKLARIRLPAAASLIARAFEPWVVSLAATTLTPASAYFNPLAEGFAGSLVILDANGQGWPDILMAKIIS
jgi:hypothetical protein